MRTAAKMIGIVTVFLLLMLCVLPAVTFAGSSETATKSAVRAQPEKSAGTHMLEWGVMLYAVGEVAGLVGKGIREITKEKKRKKRETAPTPELPTSCKRYAAQISRARV